MPSRRTAFHTRVSASASRTTWRSVIAVLSGTLTAASAMAGLMSWATWLQVGLLVGIAVGLVAPTLKSAAASATVACLFGALLIPGNPWVLESSFAERATSTLLAAAAALAASVLVRVVLKWRRGAGAILVGAAIVIVVANLWAVTLSMNQAETYDPFTSSVMPSFNDQLRGEVPAVLAGTDDAWFLKIYSDVGAGGDFYDVFDKALADNPQWQARSVLDFRLPTFYLASRIVPAEDVPIAFLVLASVAIVAAAFMAASVVKAPLAIPGATALAAYLLFFPLQLHLFSPESTAATLGVMSLSAYVVSHGSARWRWWCAASVALAVTATAVRETIVFLPLAAFAGAFFAPHERRRFLIGIWGAAVVALAGAYAAHVAITWPMVHWIAGAGRLWKGGVGNVLGAIQYATDFVGAQGALPWVLAGIGLVGAFCLPSANLRVCAIGATVAALLSFLVLGNRAWYEATGGQVNYWGATVVPLLYLFVPAAFALVPGASVAKGGRT